MFVDQGKIVEKNDLFCDYPYLLEDISKDQILIIDSGLLKAKVIEVNADYAVLEMLDDHLIGSRRHINLPGVKLKLPGLTEKDMSDVLFAIKENMNFIAASFIRNRENVLEIKKILKENNAEHIQIISKIENQEALENLEEIVKESDGVMVARGDLGVEIEISKLPYYQKEIMDVCFVYGKTIIVATELLKSMVTSPFPTRAEVSDVYNSVMLRTDCTMLSDETAMGNFPVQSCQMMNDILCEAEQHTNNKHKDFQITFTDNYVLDKKMIAKSALHIADEVQADYILLFTNS
ncbi:TPA: pyruvate kinase [Patescibacteria group bacterium]|nr:pyruvate kinase [Candidatus Gracilibacteria bacterium]